MGYSMHLKKKKKENLSIETNYHYLYLINLTKSPLILYNLLPYLNFNWFALNILLKAGLLESRSKLLTLHFVTSFDLEVTQFDLEEDTALFNLKKLTFWWVLTSCLVEYTILWIHFIVSFWYFNLFLSIIFSVSWLKV